MQDKIRSIYEGNIKLLSLIDKAVIRFRQGRYDRALKLIAETGDGINLVCEAVINDRDYFSTISVDSVSGMLKGILEAKQSRDYILLADLYEMQLSAFIRDIQELIINREDCFFYDGETYAAHIELLKNVLERGLRTDMGGLMSEDELERLKVNRNAWLDEPLMPGKLVECGYGAELTSCGRLTVKAPLENGTGIYLHTNGNVSKEAFIMADTWYREGTDGYIIYGFGMGYHADELAKLAPQARITVFESDLDILKLYAAFGDSNIVRNGNLRLIYDPDQSLIGRRLNAIGTNERVCVHYPSFRRGVNSERLKALVPKSDLIENC